MQLPTFRIECLTINAIYYKQIFSNAIFICQNQRFIAQGVTCFATDSKNMSNAIKSMFMYKENKNFTTSKLSFYDKKLIDEKQIPVLFGPDFSVSKNETVFSALNYIMCFSNGNYNIYKLMEIFMLENTLIKELGNKRNRFDTLCKVLYGAKIIQVDFSCKCLRQCSRDYGIIFVVVIEIEDRDDIFMVDSLITVNDGIFETELGDDRVNYMLENANGDVSNIFLDLVLEGEDIDTLFLTDNERTAFDKENNLINRSNPYLPKNRLNKYEVNDSKNITPANKFVLSNRINDKESTFNIKDLICPNVKTISDVEIGNNMIRHSQKGKDYFPLRRLLCIENYAISRKHVLFLIKRFYYKQKQTHIKLKVLFLILYAIISFIFPIYNLEETKIIEQHNLSISSILLIRDVLRNKLTIFLYSLLPTTLKDIIKHQNNVSSPLIPLNYRIHATALTCFFSICGIFLASVDDNICRGNVNILFTPASLLLSLIFVMFLSFSIFVWGISLIIGFNLPISLLMLTSIFGTTISTARYFSYKFLRTRVFTNTLLLFLLFLGLKGCLPGDIWFYTRRINPILLAADFAYIESKSWLVYFGYCVRLCTFFILLSIFHISKM